MKLEANKEFMENLSLQFSPNILHYLTAFKLAVKDRFLKKRGQGMKYQNDQLKALQLAAKQVISL